MGMEALKPGDIVDVIAPASQCQRSDLRNAVSKLRAIGLVARVPKDIFAPSVLFSNSDEIRWRHLRQALIAKDSKMIWCIRGGYGSLRLLPKLAKLSQPKKAKIFLGYSDITTLHSFFNQSWNWPTLHGPNLDRFGRESMSKTERRHLFDILYGETSDVNFPTLEPMNRSARCKVQIPGVVLGGNMAVLQSAMGTPWELDPTGSILFLEDTGERPHRVDRMLTQFQLAGWFAKARAVVFGHFLLSEAKDRRQLWSDVIRRFAEAQRIPVLRGLPVGHDPRRQMTLPFQTKAHLFLNTASARLSVRSPVLGR